MQSFGIRFGEGFDDDTLLKMLESVPKEYDLDLLVIGSNPGGVECAREAISGGKKAAIITWKNYSPAEAEGFEEDLGQMAVALDLQIPDKTPSKAILAAPTSISGSRMNTRRSTLGHIRKGRKVRQSRFDLNNELFKRGKQCRKLMRNAVRFGDLIEDALNCGWRFTSNTKPQLSMNWYKMSEEVMDFVMRENWTLTTELAEESVEIIEGIPILKDNHTVKVLLPSAEEIEVTARFLCLALTTECKIPRDIIGARRLAITCDDFNRLIESPGKTLVVGSLPESLECVGILAAAKYPVTVVTKSKVLKGYDLEISEMIVEDLKQMGVIFREQTILESLGISPDGKVLARFIRTQHEGSEMSEDNADHFDTVLLAVGRSISAKIFDFIKLGIDIDEKSKKLRVDQNNQTEIPNIYAVGEALADYPEDYEISCLSGKLLGRRLFHGTSEVMNYTMIPYVLYTPTEYAFVGISEDAALYRLGEKCVDVYYGRFRPLDFAIPFKKGKCYAKIVVLKSNEHIIGLHFYGPEAGEIIQGFGASIRLGLTLTNFRTIIGVTGTKAQEILKLKDLRRRDTAAEKEDLF